MGITEGTLENMVISDSFWAGKKILITGHTGFKGGWISLWLNMLGADVAGYSLEPPTEPSLYENLNLNGVLSLDILGDITDLKKLNSALVDFRPEIIIHMAAQSLVKKSYEAPILTYNTNVMGTVCVLEAAKKVSSVKTILNITTDKCYENKEWIWPYRENEALGGYDPYSSSKACSEIISSAYRDSFLRDIGIGLATARSGNVIGGGDWAANRIVPDTMRAFMNGEALTVRNPDAVRPWQHVLEPIYGYILLCQKLYQEPDKYADSWNFGPDNSEDKPVSQLADFMVKEWGAGATWELDQNAHPHEAQQLRLDSSKAKKYLNWSQTWSIEKALKETVRWYKAWFNNENVRNVSLMQIEKYISEV